MHGRSNRMRIAVLFALPVVVLLTTYALGQPPAEPKTFSTASSEMRYLGSAYCSLCHTQPQPQLKNSLQHVWLNEFTTWSKTDKHSLAFKNLKEERGLAMTRRLGKDVLKAETGCLGCHSASVAEVMYSSTDKKQGDAFNRADGVSCENCHGPGEKWLGEHAISWWRTKSPAHKAELGMNDLRSPSIQAEKCLSCHIGNSDEKKVVTHAMYAAGHPPLPSIEVATFGDQIPRHWRTLQEKRDNGKNNPDYDPKAVENHFAYEGDQLERSKLAVVSAAIALKTSMALLAKESNSSAAKPNHEDVPGLGWPDYARFDCTSCHHELERPSWRQDRGFTSAPGRPPVVRWPSFVAALGVEKLATDDPKAKLLLEEMKAHEAAIDDATRAKPFGRSEDMGAAAAKYAAWADRLAQKLESSKFDGKLVTAILQRLVQEASETDLDYDAARHVGWTIWAFRSDLGKNLKNGEEVDRILVRISSELRLQLPTGRDKSIEKQLSDALRTMGEYKPIAFREDLKSLAPLLAP